MTDSVRLGILGTGRMAHDFAHGMRHAANIEVTAIGSRTQDAAARFAREFGIPTACASYEAVAENPDIDLVYVATPHSCHLSNTLMCLDAGKAALCEKPFAINAGEAMRMIERAREKRLFLMEAMWSRYIPAIVRLRELLAGGTIGNAQLMIAGGAYMPAYDPDFYLFRPDLGGGVLLDAGVYLVSMASMVFGKPSKVLAVGSIGKSGVDEHDAILLQHASQAIANLFVSLRVSASPDLTVYGDRGKIHVHAPLFCPQALTVSINGEPDQVLQLPFAGNGYQFQAMDAAECIREGRTESAVMPLDETLSIMQTMDDIRRQFGLKYPMEE